MAYLFLLIAIVAAVGAAWLWRLDARQRSGEPEQLEQPERRHSGVQFPSTPRRERKAWADKNGWAFRRRDDTLAGEWSRGAAATGAPARDIVAGSAYGHELLLMDLGDLTVMAMRTGAVSDVVVDIRRRDVEDFAAGGDDLLRVMDVGDFTVYATDAGVGARCVDDRVTMALAEFPDSVRAAWLETEWALAEIPEASASDEWDALLAPLALLADAARMLPPRQEDVEFDVEDFTPSRPMLEPATHHPLAPVPAPPGPHEAELNVAAPPVVRPEEPLEMPSRRVGESHGTVPPRPVGLDEVDAIADGSAPAPDPTSPRMPRTYEEGPSIFEDSTGERNE